MYDYVILHMFEIELVCLRTYSRLCENSFAENVGKVPQFI